MPDRFHPSTVLQAYRELHPKQFDGISDHALLQALEELDPETYGLVDPLLKGAEILGAGGTGGGRRPIPGWAPDLPAGPLPTPIRTPTTGEKVGMAATRIVPAVAGGIGGFMIGGPVGAYAGGAVGSGAGETAVQQYEKMTGLADPSTGERRTALNPGVIAFETALGAVNPAARGVSVARRVAGQAGYGAGLGGVGTVGRSFIETGGPPTLQDVALNMTVGTVMGGGLQGGAEGVRSLGRYAPDFGDATGALPTDPPPPPVSPRAVPANLPSPTWFPGDDVAWQQAVDAYRNTPELLHSPEFQAAIDAQYAAEEAQLATKLTSVFGPSSARPAHAADYHTAVQAKTYLEEIAQNRVSLEQVGALRGGIETALEMGPPPSPPPPPAGLLPAGRGDPNAIRAYPPGVHPQIELVGSQAPPASRIIGGQDVGAVQPPPRFEQALEDSLQAPPGPSRLVRPPVLSSPVDSAIPRGMDEPPLLSTVQFPKGRTRQSGQYETPVGEARGRLPGIDEPRPLDNRPYASGPNAGPRRPPEQEAHATPRTVRRQVQTGDRIRYESAPSKLRAEDPATYPPEVRRELARMAWELETYPHETYGGALRKVSDPEEIAALRASGVGTFGSIAGAPVYDDIKAAAVGSFAHATRGEQLAFIRAALLEGKGNGLTDAAAQVARGRLAQEARGGLTETGERAGVFTHQVGLGGKGGRRPKTVRRGYGVRSEVGAGDALIGWEDASGARVLPNQDLDDLTRALREADTGELLQAHRFYQSGQVAEGTEDYFQRAGEELVRRGVVEPEQLELRMEGPGGAGGVKLTEFEGGPPQLGSKLDQPSLPGTEGVRAQEIPTPPVADAPFSLTPPPSKPRITPKTGSLFDNLMREEGVFIFDIPNNDRPRLKRWLSQQASTHGGEVWYHRAEQAVEDGEWDRAWTILSTASQQSYMKGYLAAKTPRARAAIEAAVRGTPLQSDFNTQIIAGARSRGGKGTAPPVPDFPPSPRVTQAGAARGRATIGPAGIINPGPPQRPLSSIAPALRSGRLDNTVLKMIIDATSAEGMSTIPGNTDSMGRVFRQIGEEIFTGKNLRLLREAGQHIPPEELAQHFVATVSDLGRGLNLLKQFASANSEELTEAAERWSMGGALRGMLGRGAPPPRVGAGGRVIGKTAQDATAALIAKDSAIYHQNMIANSLQKRRPVGILRAVHDASYPLMLMRWSTAVRDYASTQGRYTIDSLVHALTVPIASLIDPPTAQLSRQLVKERGFAMVQRGASVTPRRAWQEDLQGMFDLTADALAQAKPQDVRHYVKLLTDIPEAAAHLLGGMGGENLHMVTADVPVLRHLTNPKVQRVFSAFRRAQEMSGRVVVGSASLRSLVRVKGLDPDTLLRQPTPEIIQAVGGQEAWEDMLYTSTAQALEATFSGQLSKDSLPGALVRLINSVWPVKLGIPFPKFNFSTAPRFLYDHSIAALGDLLRFPLDAAGLTAPPGTTAGGRLYRGVRAQRIERHMLPGLALEIGKAERRQGRAMQDLLATQSEWEVRQRQIRHLTKLQGARPTEALPGLVSRLDAALEARDQLARRRSKIIADRDDAFTAIRDFRAEQKTLLSQLEDARGINAPNFSQYLARIAVGTVGLTGAAMIVRSQPEAQGTRWYQYPIPNSVTGRDEDDDPVMMDFRPFAPFVQHLFVADVLLDFYRQTNWEGYRAQIGDETLAGPVDRLNAVWDNYTGKYTSAELGAQFAQAFLSISRAAGTTLTLTDLMVQNGWASPQQASDAIIGTIGQFLARATVGLGQVKDLAGAFSEEEAKIRTPPRATRQEPFHPLASPLGHIPYASRLIPETISQTTGEAVASNYPLMRVLFGVGTTSPGFVEQVRLQTGLPGSAVYLQETGDVGYDQLLATTYARRLQQQLPRVLEGDYYQRLTSPALQRDYLQQHVFPRYKRAALAEVRATLGPTQTRAATVRGEEARRRVRWQQFTDQLEAETTPVTDLPEEPDTIPDSPEASPLTPPPPPPTAF